MVRHSDSIFPADDGRLRELILHVSERCADWDGFDPAMLERILFQADFLHFRDHGFPITGQVWRRGISSPSPRGMARALRDLALDFAVRETPTGDGLHVRRLPLALREADLSGFDGPEIAAVEKAIWFYRRNWDPAAQGPDLLDIPWRLAAPREEIPYALALIAPAAAAATAPPALDPPALLRLALDPPLPLSSSRALIPSRRRLEAVP